MHLLIGTVWDMITADLLTDSDPAALPADVRASLVTIRASIARNRERMDADAAALYADAVSGDSRSKGMDDADLLLIEREQVASLLASNSSLLAEVDAALDRVDAGTYGLCERCAQPIAPARLESRPYSTRCVGCASRS